jgi:hypothetical protein
MHPDSLGGFILGVPALLIAYFALWNRQRAVFFFAVALILVGVGYLVATGAAADIGRLVLPS